MNNDSFRPPPPGIKAAEMFHDPAVADVWEHTKRWAHSNEKLRWRSFLHETIRRTAISPAPADTVAVEGEVLQRYVANAHAAIVNVAEREAVAISKRRWLNYSRRLPEYAFADPGDPPDMLWESPYETSIFDALTGLYGSNDDPADGPRFSVIPSEMAITCRLLECVRLLVDLHEVYRWSGRGRRYVIAARDVIPRRIPDPALDQAIKEYRSRSNESQNTSRISFLGTVGARTTDKYEPTQIWQLTRVLKVGWQMLPDLSYKPDKEKGLGVYQKFTPVPVSLSPLASLLNAAPQIAADFEPSLATVMALVASCGPYIFANRMSVASHLMYGFVQGPRSLVDSIVTDGFERATELLSILNIPSSHLRDGADVVRGSLQLPPIIWPVRRGALIRGGKDLALIDLYGASTLMNLILRRIRTEGPSANVRASDFERVVQQVIDTTAWKPEANVAALRSRTLRVGGAQIGEIDAIATKNDTLLLVSCKSRVHDVGFEIGDYSATRNAQDLAARAVAEWNSFIAKIRVTPRGDNFDFSRFGRLLGIVCFSFRLFINDSALHNAFAAPGLKSLVTLPQLEDWLKST